ncbi:tyrosine-protein phosphatase [Micropruina sp.]|uniref:tyrosine-protein phosphatase n=1 Tax=Micropruina sp. TaxID=2737536 RepID=UPI0039E36EE9
MRALDWDGYLNCRDLGGLPTPSGPTLPGRVARGPRRELLTATGWAHAHAWGLRTVVDLRCPDETGCRSGDPAVDSAAPHGTKVILSPTEDHANAEFRKTCFPILDSPEYWPHNLRILPGLIRRTLKAIAAAEPGILIHCSAGRDRTGMITAVLLANAGVAPEVIAEDYAESVVAMAGAQANSATADRQATWGSVEVDAWLVTACPLVVDFAAGIDRYLSQAGVQRVERDRLRSLLLAD